MKVGFIGFGNIAKAISNGIEADSIYVSDRHKENMMFAQQRGYGIFTSNINVASVVDILFLTVKPKGYEALANEIKNNLNENTILVSVAPNITFEKLTKMYGNRKIVRLMPNVASSVKEGMSTFAFNDKLDEEERLMVYNLFSSFSKAVELKEELIDKSIAISGSAPAYVFMFIEALADGAVKNGIPRDTAYTLAAQTLLGSAKLVLESGLHPGELKDKVTSVSGTTIEAVIELEKKGFRGSVLSAVEACTNKKV